MSARTPARLSSGLLSRKGMAAPSAGPEARANMVGVPDETTRPQVRPDPARSTLADWVAPEPAPAAGARRRPGQVAQTRIRVSLRLDEDRHTRLKLVATQRNCTLQSLFTEAIDEFFVRHAPDLHGISAHLRRGAVTTSTGPTNTGATSPGAKVSDGKIRRGTRDSEGRYGPSRSR